MTAAAVLTYDSLVDAIQTYLERTDAATIAKIPLFIMLAEQDIATKIKFLGNLTVVTGVTVQGSPTILKPARWRKTVSMNVTVSGRKQPVLLRTYEYLRNYWPNSSTTGTPAYYGDYDYAHWLVAPTPDAAYAFEVLYYERVQPLSSANQTNWFTQYAPSALLYGSLLQAMLFLKNDARIATWKPLYDEQIESLKMEDLQRIADRQATALDK